MQVKKQRPKKQTGTEQRARLAPEDRRAELLESVRALVVARGYAGLTVSMVTGDAGVAHGTFYHYFGSLEEAFLALISGVLRPIGAGIASLDVAAIKTRAQLQIALEGFYAALGQGLREDGLVLREALFSAGRGEGVRAFVDAQIKLMIAAVARSARKASGRPPFRSLQSRVTATAIVGMVLGAIYNAETLKTRDAVRVWSQEMARFETGALAE